MKKSIDGFFVDNCDVYYVYPKKKIFKGLSVILEGLKAKGKAVIINSGNDFLDKYCSEGGNWRKIITGINQECVFSSINWDDNTFGEAKKEDQKFFRNYIEKYCCAPLSSVLPLRYCLNLLQALLSVCSAILQIFLIPTIIGNLAKKRSAFS